MTGAGHTALKPLAYTAFSLIIAHTVISVILTWKSVTVWMRTGTFYLKENKMFLARRISGAVIMVMIIIHMSTFSVVVDGVYRLQPFTGIKLACQIILVASIALHVISNVKPALISFGIRSFRSRTAEIIIILSVTFAAMTVAFVIYWLRWNG